MLKFFGYSKCDTCRKAKAWLLKRGQELQEVDITTEPPSLADLQSYLKKSGKPLAAFLNRSGVQYRALNMKEKVKTLSEGEILKLLAKEGRLIKRPIVSDGKKVTVGFDEKEFKENWA